MPNAALHFLFARRVLEGWEARPIRAPFEPGPATRNAFYHGSLAPDMGYFPGAESLLSRLAHQDRTGALCRALVEGATSDVQRAFAWGWVTHVLADVAVHPLVNEACGEILLGRRTPVWGERAGAVHVQVEIGLDAAYRARAPEHTHVRLRPALAPRDLRFLLRGYARTYGAAPSPRRLLAAHHRVTRLSAALGVLQRLAARALTPPSRPVHALARAAAVAPLRLLGTLCPAGSEARGLFTPLAPPAWLLAEVDAVLDGFADWFGAHHGSGLRFLRDHCLDTGEVVPADAGGSLRNAA